MAPMRIHILEVQALHEPLVGRGILTEPIEDARMNPIGSLGQVALLFL
jgi:hypothetical protein